MTMGGAGLGIAQSLIASITGSSADTTQPEESADAPALS
jgi:hypothetical protein